MKQYYECHITMLGQAKLLKPVVEETGWIFSCIENDICLGEGVKCYATMHYSVNRFQLEQVIANTEDLATKLKGFDINVLRTKVELVLYDSKQHLCKASQD